MPTAVRETLEKTISGDYQRIAQGEELPSSQPLSIGEEREGPAEREDEVLGRRAVGTSADRLKELSGIARISQAAYFREAIEDLLKKYDATLRSQSGKSKRSSE